MRKASRRIVFTAALAAASLAAAMSASAALATTAINPANAPNGAKVVGTASCAVGSDGLTVTCSSYQISGVGNTNANAGLVASYSATVTCTNKGGQTVPVKSMTQTAPTSSGKISPQNGKMTVPSLNSGPVPTAADFEKAATCPNGNWTKTAQTSTIALSSFTYSLTFVGFNGPFILITGP